MTNWQDVGSGVMVWAPPGPQPEKSDIGTMAPKLAKLSVNTEIVEGYQDEDVATEADSILENLRAKQAIFQELFGTPRDTRSATRLVENETFPLLEKHIFVTITQQSIPSSAASQHSARLSTRSNSVPSVEERNALVATPKSLLSSASSKTSEEDYMTPNSVPFLEDTHILDYDSDDGTDFLATPESPCPAKGRKDLPRETRFRSHYFKRASTPKRFSSVRRTLDFRSSHRGFQSLHKPKKMGVKALEYTERHNWSDEERKFLCVLFRFYARRPTDFARIYNHVFEQDLPMTKIRDQLERHLRLYGPDAYPVYKAVFSIPFSDPVDEYEAMRNIIETAAAELNIQLQRLSEEVVSPSGKAKFSRCPRIRKTYRSLVKRAKHTHMQSATKKIQYNQAMRPGGFAFRADAPFEAIDLVVDKEDDTPPLPKPTQYPPTTSSPMPSLAFRTWDEGSGTLFCEEEGFQAGAVGIWNGHIPPFRLEDPEGKRMILVTCNSHFGQDKIPSYWISVFTSLLETLVKAASMKRPRIAIIDLHHPSMQVSDKMLPAAKVMRELKSSGQTQWARTKHYAEVLVWHSIPKSAIIRSFDLRDLISLSDTNPVVGQMLQLHEFRTGRKTAAVAASLALRNITLDPFSAKAMAMVCKEFGLIELIHIHHLVARLIDGWSIIDDASADIEHVGLTFAMILGSRLYSREDIVHAFVEGCREGTHVLQYWNAVRSSGSRRTRRR